MAGTGPRPASVDAVRGRSAFIIANHIAPLLRPRVGHAAHRESLGHQVWLRIQRERYTHIAQNPFRNDVGALAAGAQHFHDIRTIALELCTSSAYRCD